MFSSAQPVITSGSTIVVTGVSGFIGSHVADKLLEAGYLVHGITRNSEKNGWVAELFDKKYGAAKFKLFQVQDFTSENGLNESFDGTITRQTLLTGGN